LFSVRGRINSLLAIRVAKGLQINAPGGESPGAGSQWQIEDGEALPPRTGLLQARKCGSMMWPNKLIGVAAARLPDL